MLGRYPTSHIVEMHYFFKKLVLYSQAQIRHTKYIVMMIKEGSPKIVNYMKLGAGSCATAWPYTVSHIAKMHYLLLYQYTAHRLLLYKEFIMLLSYAIVDFYFFL